jgi:hypothetical protein
MNSGNIRAELFAALESLVEMVPEMRTGQVLAALGELCSDLHGRGLGDAEDEELLEALWRFHSGIEQAVAERPAWFSTHFGITRLMILSNDGSRLPLRPGCVEGCVAG